VTIEQALKEVNVEPEKIYKIDHFEDHIIAIFYKDKRTEQNRVDLFKRHDRRLEFIIQQEIKPEADFEKDITFGAYLQDRTEKLPEFSFQYGIIYNPDIEMVNLHMQGDDAVEDRYAKIIEIDGFRVWYTFLDNKKIFNIQQGISKDGELIYSNSD